METLSRKSDDKAAAMEFATKVCGQCRAIGLEIEQALRETMELAVQSRIVARRCRAPLSGQQLYLSIRRYIGIARSVTKIGW
jgi:hypothetical protein